MSSKPTKPSRSVRLVRPWSEGLAVIRITEVQPLAGGRERADSDYYLVRVVDAAERAFALCKLGTRELYAVRLGTRTEHQSCECLGHLSSSAPASVCRHIGALRSLLDRPDSKF